MKVIRQDADRLLVRHMPWMLGGVLFLFGAACLLAAFSSIGSQESVGGPIFLGLLGVAILLFGWWFAPVVELDFDREAGLLRFSEIRLYRRRLRDFPLTPQTRIGQQADHGDGARLTRLVLHAGDEVVPLERGFGSGDRDAIEAEINRWLEGGATPSPPIDPEPRAPRPTPRDDDATVRRRR